MKHLLSLLSTTPGEISDLLNLADQLKYENKHGIAHQRLKGQTLGMIFQKSSTRTRVSFETGMYQLGGQAPLLSNRHAYPPPQEGGGGAYTGYRKSSLSLYRRHYDKNL